MNDISCAKLGDKIDIFINAEHRFGTDAFLLSDFAGGRHKDYVCDFCTGCGIVALLTFKNFSPAHIDALEIQQTAHELLKQTVGKNDIQTITPLLGDLKEYRSDRELDLITCNPPYKISGTGAKNDSEAVSIARHEVMCTIADVCKAAARNLKFGGRLCICQRPERLADIFSEMRAVGIEPKRLRTVHKNPEGAPWLVLVEGKKGGKPFLSIEKPLYVCDDNGDMSAELKRIYFGE